MAGQAIHFGTSGWRGIIAEDFAFSGVRRASEAIASHLGAGAKSIEAAEKLGGQARAWIAQ
jgi:phosphomannomutase